MVTLLTKIEITAEHYQIFHERKTTVHPKIFSFKLICSRELVKYSQQVFFLI